MQTKKHLHGIMRALGAYQKQLHTAQPTVLKLLVKNQDLQTVLKMSYLT